MLVLPRKQEPRITSDSLGNPGLLLPQERDSSQASIAINTDAAKRSSAAL